MSGIPGFCKITVGTEATFGTNAATHSILNIHEYERFNPSVNLMDTDTEVRCNLGPTAGIVGNQAVQDFVLKLWAQSGVTPVTGAPAGWSGVLKEIYESLPGVGTGNTGYSKGGATVAGDSIVSGVTVIELTGENANIADYSVGASIIVADDDTGANELAVITALAANVATPANLDVTLDRTLVLGGGGVASIAGCYTVPINPTDNGGIRTTDSWPSLSFEQTDHNSITDRMLGACCSSYSLTSEASDDGASKLIEEITYKVNEGDTAVTAEAAPVAALTKKQITVHDWGVVINKLPITRVASVVFSLEAEVSSIPDISSAQGRSGMMCTGIVPKITITALKDSNWASLESWFNSRTEVPVSIDFSPNALPVGGDYMGLYAPKCVVTDPYVVEDGDLQMVTIEFTCLYDSDNGHSAVLTVG